MATEEVSNKPTSLPQYPEMILNALDELNEEGGSSKSAISSHIESTHKELSDDHSKLLTEHLNMMKEKGEIVFFKNNYMRFNPDAPPKRGRGRPKKDPNAPPTPKKTKISDFVSGAGTGRPRGRPPKNKNGESGGVSEGEKEKSVRPRGRPPKSKPQQAHVGVQDGQIC